jgi:hypothetical protein
MTMLHGAAQAACGHAHRSAVALLFQVHCPVRPRPSWTLPQAAIGVNDGNYNTRVLATLVISFFFVYDDGLTIFISRILW